MKKKAKRRSAIDVDCLPGEADIRPESSPYAASIVNLQLKDATILRIPSPLLRKCPKLPDVSPWSQTIRLEITQEVGHILVHYLFTNTYQCLKPKGLSPQEEVAAEFTTSIRVYALAREYELPSLADLAKLEIERLGDGLRFPMVLDLVRDAYPDPGVDDAWFSNYLKTGLKSLLQNPSELSDCGMPNTERKTLSVSDLLFKNLVELVCNHDILSRGLNTTPQIEVLEESALVMQVPELGSPEEAALKLDDLNPPEVCGQDPPMGSEADLAETCELDLPEAEPEPYEPRPKEEPDLVAKMKEDDFWGFTVSKKDKKKKNRVQTVEVEPEPEPDSIRILDPEPEPKMVEEEDVCFTVSKKDKKKKKRVQTLELKPEPKPDSVRVLDPEPELEKVEQDDLWGFTVSKKDKKRKKAQAFEPEPELEPEKNADDDIADPEPEKCEEDDIWGFTVSKRDKKMKQTQTLELEPEPVKKLVLEPGREENIEDDFWGFGASKKRDKKKKKKMQMFGSEPEAEKEDNFRSIQGTSKPEAATDPKPDSLEEVAREERVEAAPAVTDGWSFGESDGKETKPKAGCNLRAEHVFGNGWEECYNCQDFIRQLSRQLLSERS